MNVVPITVPTLTHIFHVHFNGVKMKITHSIAPINLHAFINVTGMPRSVNVCLILTNLDS